MVEAAASFRLACRMADDTVFRLKDRTISAARFLAMARQLAGELPSGEHVINLCQDRLHFTVALAAAVLRGQVSLLTGDRTPDRLDAVVERFPGLYSLSDDPAFASPLRHHRVRLQPGAAGADVYEDTVIPSSRIAAIVFTSG